MAVKRRKKTKRVKSSSGVDTEKHEKIVPIITSSESSDDDTGMNGCELPTKTRVLVERIINRITKHGTIDGFSEQEIFHVLDASYNQLRPQPALAHVKVPVVIFGDIHGQLSDLQRFLAIVGTPPKAKLLFLGDYVDRCNKGIEVAILLLCYKLRYPAHIDLLRGNHECQKLNRIYGFYTECRAKMSVRLWKAFQRVFYELPLCARVGRRILTMHGGISPEIKSWDSLTELNKPRTNEECDNGIPVDLMWSDPSRDDCTKGFQPNTDRGTSYIFGDDVVRAFNEKLDIDLVVRAHEVVRKGHLFNASQQMCTIFSAPNYCGTEGNCASVMRVSKQLEVSFVTLKPQPNTEALTKMSAAELQANQERFLLANAKSPKPGTKPTPSAFVVKQATQPTPPPNVSNTEEKTQDVTKPEGQPIPPSSALATPPFDVTAPAIGPAPASSHDALTQSNGSNTAGSTADSTPVSNNVSNEAVTTNDFDASVRPAIDLAPAIDSVFAASATATPIEPSKSVGTVNTNQLSTSAKPASNP